MSEPTNSRVHRRCSQKEKISTLVREAQVEHKANYGLVSGGWAGNYTRSAVGAVS